MEGRSLVRGGGLLLLLSLIRMGIGAGPGHSPLMPDAADERAALQEESRADREEKARRSRPLEADERLDPNRSPEEELDRLPGVGPSVAEAVVAHRTAEGGYRRPEDLLDVRGIGPATLEKIRPHLDFSRGVPLELARRGPRPGDGHGADGVRRLTGSPGGKGATAAPGPERIDLNRAGSRELQTLPGIGPALAERILASRAREGPFREPDDLLRVPGIGPVTLARLRGRIRVGR